MYTIMLWVPKGELRAVRRRPNPNPTEYETRRNAEFEFLPEHEQNPPTFMTQELAEQFIHTNYPHLAP